MVKDHLSILINHLSIKGCLRSRNLESDLELIVNYDETENIMSYSQASLFPK